VRVDEIALDQRQCSDPRRLPRHDERGRRKGLDVCLHRQVPRAFSLSEELRDALAQIDESICWRGAGAWHAERPPCGDVGPHRSGVGVARQRVANPEVTVGSVPRIGRRIPCQPLGIPPRDDGRVDVGHSRRCTALRTQFVERVAGWARGARGVVVPERDAVFVVHVHRKDGRIGAVPYTVDRVDAVQEGRDVRLLVGDVGGRSRFTVNRPRAAVARQVAAARVGIA
jgi:hypothetical protein